MQDVVPQEYRDAMACLGAAVSIVTTDGKAGRAGFTASAICSVTDDPPTLLVCINRSSSTYSNVTRNVVALRRMSSGYSEARRNWRAAAKRHAPASSACNILQRSFCSKLCSARGRFNII